MSTVLYTTHCPACNTLKYVLDKSGIEYEECDDIEEMMSLGLMYSPALGHDGRLMNMKQAMDWIKEVKGEAKR